MKNEKETVEDIVRSMRRCIPNYQYFGKHIHRFADRIEKAHAETMHKLAIARFTLGEIPLIFRHTDPDYRHETRECTVKELLEYINEGHSDAWTDYDESDWQEGMKEWTDLTIDWDWTMSSIIIDFEETKTER